MKLLRALPILLFFINLGLGIFLATKFTSPKSDTTGQPIITLANKQRTILLIVVDRLERDASLAGLWALIYTPDFSDPTWVPIYPAVPGGNTARANQLAAAFHLTKNLQPDLDFLSLLRKNNLAWSGYLVLDGEAILEAMKVFAVANRPLDTTEWLALVSVSEQDQQIALANQIGLLESICDAAVNRPPSFDLFTIYPHLQKHSRANFDLSLAFSEWALFLLPGKTLKCHFPALDTAQP